jgi:gliding motility-associated-like protein
MYVNLSNYAEFTIHNFGAFISSVKPDDGVWCDTFSTYHPQLIVAYLTDTLNWVKQEVEFIAQGGEKWLTIGRFDFDGPSQLLAVTPDTTPFSPIRYAYYMVDSVSLIDITDPENLPNIQNVISPNHDGINDVFALPEYDFLFGEKVTIYSRWGNEVAILDSSNTYWNGLDQSGQNVSEGSYFFIFSATTKEGKTIYKKGTLSVFR